MNKKYRKNAAPLRFASPSTVFAVLGALALLAGGVIWELAITLSRSGAALAYPVSVSAIVILGVGTFGLGLAAMLALALPDDMRICQMVRRGLFDPAHGNPLNLKDGEILPPVACTAIKTDDGYRRYILRIFVKSCTADDITASSARPCYTSRER